MGMSAQRSIVIGGGAFAGLALALALRQGLGPDIPVIVADPALGLRPSRDPRATAIVAACRRLLLVLAAFAIYFLVMPVLGNMIASALFLLASMWLLSDDPNRSIVRLAIYAVAIAIIFEWFFVRLLKVQMPAGVFKQWLF